MSLRPDQEVLHLVIAGNGTDSQWEDSGGHGATEGALSAQSAADQAGLTELVELLAHDCDLKVQLTPVPDDGKTLV